MFLSFSLHSAVKQALFPTKHSIPSHFPKCYSVPRLRTYSHFGNSQTKSYKLLTGSFGIPKKPPVLKQKVQNSNPNPNPNPNSNSTSDSTASPVVYPWQHENSGYGELSVNVGEDAYFLKSDALGVADGIGSWSYKQGADSALFSKRLLSNTHYEITRFDDIEDDLFIRYAEATPVQVLENAFTNTLSEMKQVKLSGSSTVCLALLRNDELRVANLGDSGLTIIRGGDLVFHTDEQQHSFNYPYQLSTEKNSDSVTDAQVFRIKVKKGDLVILGSDGVYDNLFDEDILDVISKFVPPKMLTGSNSQQPGPNNHNSPFSVDYNLDLDLLSKTLAERAYNVSVDPECTESPFQLRAIHEGLYYHGGKADDITVVSAMVVDLEDSPNRR